MSSANILTIGIASVSLILTACHHQQRQLVVAATGTNIGLEVGSDPATQTPVGKLGYNRAELALVPTNRSGEVEAGDFKNGAADVPDVLMELRYKGIFSFEANTGIYQRLAVGKTAVGQPGAAFMFAKDADGDIKKDTAEAVKEAVVQQ